MILNSKQRSSKLSYQSNCYDNLSNEITRIVYQQWWFRLCTKYSSPF